MRLFDLHCDTLYECYETDQSLRENTLSINRAKAAKYAMYTQVFALFCGTSAPKGIVRARSLMDVPPHRRLDALLETAYKIFSDNADWLTLCRTMEDWEWAYHHGKHAAFLSIEGAELIEHLGGLERAYEAGVRLVTLTWNGRNAYACGAATDNECGFTARGKELIDELVHRSMIIDVSHLSDAGFWELCTQTEAPFAATHSNSRAVCAHPRNLTDFQLCEIFRRGGLVGLNLYAPFLRDDEQCATIDDVLRHAERMLELGGHDCIALGADFDGCDQTADGLDDLSKMDALAQAMLQQGWLQSTVDAIFFDNAHNFFTRMLG